MLHFGQLNALLGKQSCHFTLYAEINNRLPSGRRLYRGKREPTNIPIDETGILTLTKLLFLFTRLIILKIFQKIRLR